MEGGSCCQSIERLNCSNSVVFADEESGNGKGFYMKGNTINKGTMIQELGLFDKILFRSYRLALRSKDTCC